MRTAEYMKTGYKMQTVANAVKSLSSVFEYLGDTETASMYDTSVERLCSKCYVMINFTCSCCHTYIRLLSRYNPFFFSSWHQRVITNYIFSLSTVVFFFLKRQRFFARVDFLRILEENLKMSQL